jgi:hypothetical protein
MPKLPSLEDVKRGTDEEYKYDFGQASRILEAMDFLRGEAVNTRIPEIITMIDASFQLLLTTYYCLMRYGMKDLPPSDEGLQ